MKKIFLIGLFIISSVGFTVYAAGLRMGMTGAVKQKVKELDKKVVDHKLAVAIQTCPTNLIAVVVSSTQINLSWTDNATVTGFYVERSTAEAAYAQIASVTVKTYSDTGLAAATTYWYRVRAYNGAGNSGYSAAVSAETMIPQSISGTAAQGRAVALAVILVKDVNGSVLTTTTDITGNYTIDVTTLTFPILLKITDGTTTYFSIANSSGTCNIHPFTDLVVRTYFKSSKGISNMDDTFENHFSLLGTLPAAEIINTIKAAVTNIISTILERQGIDPLSYDMFTTNFSANSLGFDKAIEQVQIAADTDFGRIVVKDIFLDTVISTITPTANDTTPPSTPTNLSAVAISETSLRLQWDASLGTDIAGYAIYRNGVKIAIISSTTYIDTGLLAGTKYSYAIEAYDWAGNRSAKTYTPPWPPTSWQVNGSTYAWGNVPNYSITWTNPWDLSGVAGAWYKQSSTPTSNTDGYYVQQSTYFFLACNTNTLVEGYNSLYLWLQDNAGDTDCTLSTTVVLLYDITPPKVTGYSCPAFSPNGDWRQESTLIHYTLDDNFSKVIITTIQIYDSQNNLVKTPYSGVRKGLGPHELEWNGRNNSGVIVPEGIYQCRITAVDEATNAATIFGPVIVDTNPPVISSGSIIITPGNHPNAFTCKDTLSVSFDIYDTFSPSAKVDITFSRAGAGSFTKQEDFSISSGTHQNLTYQWDGKDYLGNTALDGVYAVQLKATDETGITSNNITVLGTFIADRTPVYFNEIHTGDFIFHETVTVYYNLRDDAQSVDISVEDLFGNTVLSFSAGSKLKNTIYSWTWDGKDTGGATVPGGSYDIKIKTIDDVGNEWTEHAPVIKN